MALRSLRARLLVGSLLWALGVLLVATLISLAAYHLHPSWAPILHNSLLTIFAVVVMVVGLSQLRRGLSPFDALRARLTAVRDGRDKRIDGTYPTEVQPLVDDLNTLLEDRERRIARAVARAGDLAHGLKTPLTVLAQEAERAAAAGQRDLADVINQQVAKMRRQVDSHLAQARVSASGATVCAPCSVAPAVDALLRTMRRVYAIRDLEFDARIDDDLVVRVDVADLEEMLGNLLDNACKWAARHVRLSAERAGTDVHICVDDDGPGLAEDLRQAVLSRGVRADETAPGSGWGLAIVDDLARAYRGAIALEASALGGLRAVLRLPA